MSGILYWLTLPFCVQVDEDQVVMAHSPLKLFEGFMSKHMLVSGQGPVCEIAYNLGFRNITTIEELRQTYPQLDCVDQKRRSLQVPLLSRSYTLYEGITNIKVFVSQMYRIDHFLFVTN